MGILKGKMKKELQLLFYALCDGLRQEVRQRSLTNLVTRKEFPEGFSIIEEREVGLASLLVLHLRSVGFMVQLDAYFHGNTKRRRTKANGVG